MKSYLLYFFAFLALTFLLPFCPDVCSVSDEEKHTVAVKQTDGSVAEIAEDDYVCSVLLTMLSSDTPDEAACAYAVAVRSCTRYICENGLNHSDCDVCEAAGCCFRRSDVQTLSETVGNEQAALISEQALSACAKTSGLVLTYEKMPAMALWHICSGSRTRSCERFPYLVSVENVDESGYEKFKSTSRFDYEMFSSLTGASLSGEDDAGYCCLLYDISGRCSDAVFGKTTLSGDELVSRLSLPSSDVTLTYGSDGIDAVCVGVGSGYGMSLVGAGILASDGKNFNEILAFYFPKLEINKIQTD